MILDYFPSEIDQLSSQYKTLYSDCPPVTLNLKPNPDTWSLGQILEHIIIINTSFFSIIAAAKTNSLKLPWISSLSFVHQKFGQMILKSVHPDTVKKTKTFSIWRPSPSNISSDILIQFIEHQESLTRIFQSSTDLIKSHQLIHSPANRFIVYSLETAFKMILLHEQRHLNQAVRTKQLIFEKA